MRSVPTELLHFAEEDADTLRREQSRRALRNIRNEWRFLPVPLTDLQKTYATSIAGKLLAQGRISKFSECASFV
jgi:hypothetical protein